MDVIGVIDVMALQTLWRYWCYRRYGVIGVMDVIGVIDVKALLMLWTLFLPQWRRYLPGALS